MKTSKLHTDETPTTTADAMRSGGARRGSRTAQTARPTRRYAKPQRRIPRLGNVAGVATVLYTDETIAAAIAVAASSGEHPASRMIAYAPAYITARPIPTRSPKVP